MKKIYTITLLTLLVACSEVFNYSPYSARVSNNLQNTTRNNVKLLKGLELKDTIVLALVSDSHFYFGDLGKIVKHINKDNSVSAVLYGGDMADKGLLKEFELFHSKMDELEVPYFTVIGNHDYRSNGESIYKDMFGDYNYSIELGNNKIIFFDNIHWESSKEPDFDWLEKELKGTGHYDHKIVLAHIPPYNDQFNTRTEKIYRDLMTKYKVNLSVHGHDHDYRFLEYYKDKIPYLTIGSVDKGYYVKLYLTKDKIEVKRIKF